MLHQIVCSKRLLRWNLMIRKLKEREYEKTTYSSSNICNYNNGNKRMSHHLFVKVGIKITIQQEQHFSKRICAVLSPFLKSVLLLYRYTKGWWTCKTNLFILYLVVLQFLIIRNNFIKILLRNSFLRNTHDQ